MRKIPLFIASAVACVLLSCSKDLRHTNRIHGTWDITRIEAVSTTGTTHFSIDPDGVMQFDKCDVRPDDFRAYRHDYTYHDGDSVVLQRTTGTYKFDDKGQRLVVHTSENGATVETVYHIVSFERKEILMETHNPDHSRTVYLLERQ